MKDTDSPMPASSSSNESSPMSFNINTTERTDAKKIGILTMLDGILRNQESFFEDIFEGRNLKYFLKWFFMAIFGLMALYGFSMGSAGFRNGLTQGFMQTVSSGVKVPMLYLLSILVCYPVLYFIVVLMGSKLNFVQTFVLILLALVLNSILLAGCAPIVLFFTFTGSSYEFIKLIHVAIFVFSGSWAMQTLWRGLTAMCEKSDLYPRQAVQILQVWVLVFGFVGIQMAWSLRPFVGSPDRKFQIIRTTQDGNFYQMVWNSFVDLSKKDL